MKNTGLYDDMVDLPHHVSKKHRQMPLADRAAQFAPFAALSGYGSDITEAGRTTERKAELDEYAIAAIDGKLRIIQDMIADMPEVTVIYFVPDASKTVGMYVDAIGRVAEINEYEHILVMNDGKKIPINDISKIESDIFGMLM